MVGRCETQLASQSSPPSLIPLHPCFQIFSLIPHARLHLPPPSPNLSPLHQHSTLARPPSWSSDSVQFSHPGPPAPRRPIGAVWARPTVAPCRLPRQAPQDVIPVVPSTSPRSSSPLPVDLPLPMFPAHTPPSSPRHHTQSSGTLPTTSSTSLPRPNNLAHSHTDRANTCRSSSRLNKRACSNSDHSVHGTVLGRWTGTQLTEALSSLLDLEHRLLRRQVKVHWHGRRLAVNIWNKGRVHVQGKGHFAQLLSVAHASSSRHESQPPRTPAPSGPCWKSHLFQLQTLFGLFCPFLPPLCNGFFRVSSCGHGGLFPGPCCGAMWRSSQNPFFTPVLTEMEGANASEEAARRPHHAEEQNAAV